MEKGPFLTAGAVPLGGTRPSCVGGNSKLRLLLEPIGRERWKVAGGETGAMVKITPGRALSAELGAESASCGQRQQRSSGRQCCGQICMLER